MSSLAEIEESFRILDNDLSDEEVDLLLRAVRQLGKGRRYKNGRLDGGTWVPYDPDVLELLEKA